MATRRELTGEVSRRYREADRISRKLILDEFTKITGYHRKHAIRLLTAPPSPTRERPCRPVYKEAVREALVVLWEASDRICGKRLKAAAPFLVEAMERHGHLRLEEAVRSQLMAMSAATMDRHLRSIREQAYGGRKRKRAAPNPPEDCSAITYPAKQTKWANQSSGKRIFSWMAGAELMGLTSTLAGMVAAI